MACAHPFKIKNIHYVPSSFDSHLRNEYIQVPCNRCPSCLRDRQKSLEDRCNYSFNQYGCGAFVTLTYNDIELIEHCSVKHSDKTYFSIRNDDFKKFMKRFRRFCDYHNLWNGSTLNKNFSYIYSSEYGGLSSRPHFHFLAFGLDYAALLPILNQTWSFGFAMSLPIKNGAIRYVLKYLNKQSESVCKSSYDDLGLERPYSYHSKNLGVGLYESQKSYILSHNLSYRVGSLNRPLPTYYKNKLLKSSIPDNSNTVYLMKNDNIIPDLNDVTGSSYSASQINDYKISRALNIEKNLIRESYDNGASIDYSYLNSSSYSSYSSDELVSICNDYLCE